MPDLAVTHFFALPTATIAATSFPTRTRDVSFRAGLRVVANAGQHRGLIFEIGSSAAGVAAWLDDDTIAFRAGGTGNGAALAEWTIGSELPVGLRVDLLFAVRPGTGEVRIFADGQIRARAQSVDLGFPSGEWAASSAGSFAAAVSGTTPADVTQTGAPSGFTVVSGLYVYMGQIPQHFG